MSGADGGQGGAPANAGGDGGTAGSQGGDGGTNAAGGKEFQPITTQADLDRILGARLSRENAKYADYDTLKASHEELKKLKDAEKSEVQKANDRADELEKKYQAMQRRELQRDVAEAKGVPLKHAHRLQGATREELEADADEYLADYTPAAKEATRQRLSGKPRENLRGGRRPGCPTPPIPASLRQ